MLLQSVMGVNLETLRPEPIVEGYTTPGGYSGKAVKPIALAKVRVPCSYMLLYAALGVYCSLQAGMASVFSHPAHKSL